MAKSIVRTPAQEIWPQREFSKRGGELTLPLLPVFIYSFVQLIRVGSHHNHYIFMLIGCVLSVGGMLAYIISSYTHGATGKKSIGGMLMALAGFLPFLFGCYLIVYQGFWGFKELTHGFSLWLVVKAIVAILLGYRVVYVLDKITELSKTIKPIDDDGLSLSERLDHFLAIYGTFQTALPLKSKAQQMELVQSMDIDGVLSLKKEEQVSFEGKKYRILHFSNQETNQERSVYFDIT